jgi:hypothetical protein
MVATQSVERPVRIMNSRELYQQSVIILVGTRRSKSDASVVDFLAGHAALLEQLRLRWAALEDKGSLPSPDQVLAWL